MSTTPDVKTLAVIILNWNGLERTLACVASVVKSAQLPRQILVVDNGSHPSQVAELQAQLPANVTVLRVEQNLGFAGGMNVGIQTVLQDPAIQHVLLLNNDTLVDAEALSHLMDSLNVPDVGLVGARMMSMQHPDKIENRGVGISSWGLAWNITQPEVIPSLAGGGCVLLRREVLEQLLTQGQVFDERFYLYVEDVDLGLRARALGWRGVTNDQAVVQHTGGASSQLTPDIPLYYWHRNSVWMAFKNFPAIVLVCNFFPLLFLHLGIAVLYTFKGKGRVVWKAKWDAVRGLPHVLKQRRAQVKRLTYADFHSLKHSNWSAVRAWKRSFSA